MDKLQDHSTPGPWAVNTNVDNKQSQFVKITAENGIHIVWVGPKSIVDRKNLSDTEEMANAHLIAAAPEMRDFISDFLEEMDGISGITPELSTLITRAEELLKKAYNF